MLDRSGADPEPVAAPLASRMERTPINDLRAGSRRDDPANGAAPAPLDWHARVRELFATLAERSPEERRRELDARCAGDPALRAEVESLLAHDAAPGIEAPEADVLCDAVAKAAGAMQAQLADTLGGTMPERVGGYRIVGVLGEGGMGVVYLAEQDQPRRTVALKLMRPGVASRHLIRRFRREAEVLGRLQHPCIAAIHEAGNATIDGDRGPRQVPFFAMEYVRGESITAHARSRRLSVRERVELMVKVADAVEHAHGQGVVHRDLKPANILVDERSGGEATPKILDFGIARREGPEHAATTFQTEVGQVVGTLPYMSPEQVSGQPDAIDRRSDVYAMGVVLFELLAGRLPLELEGRSVPEAVRMVSEHEPLALATIDRSLRGDLDTIVGKCLEKDPQRRYGSAAELAADLRRHLDHRPIEARPASTLYQLGKFARRNRPLVAGVVVAFATLLLASVVAVWLALDAIDARDEAQRQLEVASIENQRSTQSFAFLQAMIGAAAPTDASGKERTVREMLDGARDRLLKESGEAPQVTAMLLRLVGGTYVELGRLEDAETMFTRAIELFREIGVENDPYYHWTLGQQGQVLLERGKHAQAKSILEEALKLGEAVGIAPLAEATLHNNLGQVAQELGEFALAERSYLRAMEIRGQSLGNPVDLAGATTQVNIGAIMMLQGRYEEAIAWIGGAIPVADRLIGPESPRALTFRNNLVVALLGDGRYEEAKSLAEQTLAARSRMFEPDHPHVVSSRMHLATIATLAGDPAAALPLAHDGVERRTRVFGRRHADTARALYIEGCALRVLGRRDEAKPVLLEAAAIQREVVGERHHRALQTSAVLAELAMDDGDATEALRQIEETLRLAQPDLGPDSRARFERIRAAALLAQGRAAEALRSIDQTLVAARKGLREGHPEITDAMLVRAEAQLAGGDAASALEVATAARQRFEAAFPGAPWRAAEADAVRARALRGLGRVDEAAALQQQARATIVAALSPTAPAASRASR